MAAIEQEFHERTDNASLSCPAMPCSLVDTRFKNPKKAPLCLTSHPSLALGLVRPILPVSRRTGTRGMPGTSPRPDKPAAPARRLAGLTGVWLAVRRTVAAPPGFGRARDPRPAAGKRRPLDPPAVHSRVSLHRPLAESSVRHALRRRISAFPRSPLSPRLARRRTSPGHFHSFRQLLEGLGQEVDEDRRIVITPDSSRAPLHLETARRKRDWLLPWPAR